MLGIILQRDNEISLSRQLYQALREGITGGRIKAGEALPSTRELARQLAVSRNTVCEAYDRLITEGFVISHQGAPTRVAVGLGIINQTTESLRQEKVPPEPIIKADFKTGQPDLRYFPRSTWNNLMREAIEELPINQLCYTGPEGLPVLREEIAKWIFRSKGISVSPQDVFVTFGATHALHLLSDMLCDSEKGIIIEDPCHMGMLRALKGQGYPVQPVSVDAQGLLIDYLPSKSHAAIYVTPSHQFPLGGILPANRRAELIRYARENNLYIIEDDYDSEFRYSGEPVSPLRALDGERVIYVGTFSKILFPALRIGYVVLPPELQGRWRYLRTHADVQNPPYEQIALAKFLKTRKMDKHVQRMRKVYGERRKTLLETLKDVFGSGFKSWGDASGLHLALEFSGQHFGSEFVKKSREFGIRITPVAYHCILKGNHEDKLLLGYGHLNHDEIRHGVQILYEFMKEIL